MDAIKKKLTLGVLVLCLAGGRIPALAQQMDPALTATVIAQTTELKNIHKKRKKTQEKKQKLKEKENPQRYKDNALFPYCCRHNKRNHTAGLKAYK